MDPKHIAVHLVAGYIYKKKYDMVNYNIHYLSAIKNFKNRGTFETFCKYLSGDNQVVKDFNKYCFSKGIEINEPPEIE